MEVGVVVVVGGGGDRGLQANRVGVGACGSGDE